MSSVASVVDATETSIAEAQRAGRLTDLDAGAVEALRVLARKIDDDDDLRQAYLDRTAGVEGVKPLQIDNVSIPTYLKFCDALGLTPAGRVKLADKKESGGGRLAQLQAVEAKRRNRSA